MNFWNSTFSIKPRPRLWVSKKTLQKMKKRAAIKRRLITSTRSTVRLTKDTRARKLNPVGRRTKDWRAVWRFLKPELEKRGRTRCEFGFIPHECFGRLDPCHSKKRRLMQGNDIYLVSLGCQNVHRILDEVFTHEQMEQAVLHAIEMNGGLILPEGK